MVIYVNMQKRHRIFIAINLPKDVKKALAGYQKKWAELPAKWTPTDNLHITLLFLGDVTDQELGEACVITKEVAARHGALDINLNKIAYGPKDKIPPRDPKFSDGMASEQDLESQSRKLRIPRYIWAGGETNKEAILLKDDLESSLLEKIPFTPEGRGFTPHITLARISAFEWRGIEPEERPQVNEHIDLEFTVESIEVMESELKKGGPQYTVIESVQLT